MFLASTAAAFLGDTGHIQIIEDDEIVAVKPDGATFWNVDGDEVFRNVDEVNWDIDAAEKGGYETFMLKEIYEQPDAIEETIGDRIRHGRLELDGLGLDDDVIRNLGASSSSRAAPLITRASSPATRSRSGRASPSSTTSRASGVPQPRASKDTLVIGITQSGETADTLAAMRLARQSRARTLAVTNMMGTQITREVDAVLYDACRPGDERRGDETFTSQVALFYLLALKLAQVRKTLPAEKIASLLDEVNELPAKMASFLAGNHPIDEIAQRPSTSRSSSTSEETSAFPSASRAPEAQGLLASHRGVLGRRDEARPDRAAGRADAGRLRRNRWARPHKVVSNIQGRRGPRCQCHLDRNRRQRGHSAPRRRRHLHPAHDRLLQAPLAVVPLEVLAYKIARLRGLNIDQPRNLAKTVTVE